MIGAFIVTGLLTLSLLVLGAYTFLGKDRTSTHSSADTSVTYTNPSTEGITPVGSKFSQYLYGPTAIPGKDEPTPTPTPTLPFSQATPTIAVVGVIARPTLGARLSSDKRSVVLDFGSLTGVLRITYTVSYNAKSGSKGVAGSIDVIFPTQPIRRDIALGTCSKNVCVYDIITTPINIRTVYRMIDGSDVELTQVVAY